ncbi:T9SS type B sorting domain-containing protein [Flavobacterium sp. SM2513]|uniref:T9SS type B sorting domain-containing protein n=1 Tax=Flavobacterium sp. SM2513 TaxID=3424766 RepID=UPI003D7FFC90
MRLLTVVFRKVASWLFWFGFLFSSGIYAQQNIINHGNMVADPILTINHNVTTTDYVYLNAPYTGSTVPGQSTVYHLPDVFNTAFIPIDDMTEGGGATLLVDGSTVPHQYFYKGGYGGSGFCGLTPGITYTFTYYIRSTTALVTGASTQADIRIDFSNATNITLLIGSTVAPLPADGWLKVSYSFEATGSCVDLNLWNYNTNAVGNDFALDEFSLFREMLPFSMTYSISKSTCFSGNSIFVYTTGGNSSSISYSLVGSSYTNTTGSFNNLEPGNYSLTVTDGDGTAINQPIIIPTSTPPLTMNPDVAICAGESTTLQVGGSNSTYYWSSEPYDSAFIDLNNPSPTVSPVVTTTYKAVSLDNVPSGNLIYNPDFSMGNVGFYSQHTYYATNFENAPDAYGVVSDSTEWGSYLNCGDHTTGSGNMLVVNGMDNFNWGGGHVIWEQAVTVDLTTDYTFSFWVQSLSSVLPANLHVSINGSIYNVYPFMAPATNACGNWVQYSVNYFSGWLYNIALIRIHNANIYFDGNEFALDDITFQTADACLSNEVTVTVAQPTTVALTASSTVSSTVAFDWEALPSVTGYSVSYTINNGTPISGGTITATDFTVNGLDPGDAVTITVVPIDAGCFGPASLMQNSFTPCEIPTASITQQPTCTLPTGIITVSAPLGTTFEYSLDGTTFQASPIFDNLALNTYTLILKNNLTGCFGTGPTLSFSPSGLQQPDVTAIQTIVDCGVVLMASSITANTTLVWNGPTLAPNSANPATTSSSGTYTATATNLLTGCTQNYSITVLPLDIPAVATVTTVLPTCTNASGSIHISGPLNSDYEYSIDGSNYQASLDFLNLPPAVYPVTVKNILTSCLSSSYMADLSLPLVTQPPVPLFATVSFCQNALPTPLIATAMPGATLNWYGQNATGGTASSIAPVLDTTILGNFIYYVSQSVGFCESVRIPILVSVYAGTLAPDFNDLKVCEGAVAPILPTISPNGIPGSWSPNVVSTAASGSYTFTPASTACASVQTITVTITLPTVLSFDWVVDNNFSNQQTVTILPVGTGNYLYQLNGGTPQSSPVFISVPSGIYSITLMDADGCSRPVTKNDVLVIGYPRFFTPNNDSYNDTWSITALFYQHDAKVDIFDRYGKLLKRLNLKNAEVWDGTYNGLLMPATDYWFTLQYINLGIKKQFSSHFSLKR